jgi:tripartite-type tricarboxylate transporter receptor subunit TctC
MPGAGGMNAANHIFRVAARDGSVISALHNNIAFAQVTGTRNVEYDARKLNWIGRMAAPSDVHYAWHTSGVKSFDDLFKRQVVVAGTGPSSNSVVYPTVLNELMGTKLKILSGFKGTSPANLALERGEVDMALKPWAGIKSGNADWLRDKKIIPIVQYSGERHPELPNLPTVLEVARTQEQREVFGLLTTGSDIGRSLSMPPGVPAARVALMRKAFIEMTRDPQMIAEAQKLKLDLDPADGAKLEKIVLSTFAISPAAIERAKTILAKNKKKKKKKS